MKKVLIISPFFPPCNAADLQRVRTSLPYFKEFGWDASVVAVDPEYTDMVQDDLLQQSVPNDIRIFKIKAFSKKLTSKFGLGSLAFRSMWQYHQKVNQILKKEKFDLIYFSTTQFPICVLGSVWKRKFGVPYVIDMQDPWYSEHYKHKPKTERPPKYRLIYGLHKILEVRAMEKVDGLISVSANYITDLKARYLQLSNVPAEVITFGAFEPDLEIALKNRERFTPILDTCNRNIVYIGRGGVDMQMAIAPVFESLKQGLANNPELFGRLKFWFIGTSYAPPGKDAYTIQPLAEELGVAGSVVEITGRISYYHALLTMFQADALFIPGSEAPAYTASKIYPCLLTKKPILAIFNEESSAVEVLRESAPGAIVLTFNKKGLSSSASLYSLLELWANGEFKNPELSPAFGQYSARQLTAKQATLFNSAVNNDAAKN